MMGFTIFSVYKEQLQLPVSKIYSRLRTTSKEIKAKMAGENEVSKICFISAKRFVP